MSSDIFSELENEVFHDIGRASDLLWLHFGEKILIKNHRGFEREKGSFGIHVQCPWRFLHHGKLLLGNMDIYLSREGVSESEFDWFENGKSVFDEKVEKIKQYVLPIKIEKMIVDNVGNLKIIFKNELVFEAMPNSSVEMEFWRFINNKTREHIVFFE